MKPRNNILLVFQYAGPIFLILGGLGLLTSSDFLSAILVLTAGALLFPPVIRRTQKIKTSIRTILIIAFLCIGFEISDTKPTTEVNYTATAEITASATTELIIIEEYTPEPEQTIEPFTSPTAGPTASPSNTLEETNETIVYVTKSGKKSIIDPIVVMQETHRVSLSHGLNRAI